MEQLKSRNFFAGLTLAAFGLLYAGFARGLKLGTSSEMGPGYFPFALSCLLIVIGLCIAFRRSARTENGVDVAWKPLLYVTLSIVLFAIIVKFAGLALSCALLVVVSLLATSSTSFKEAAVLAIGLSAGCVLLFRYLLGVAIPLFPFQW